MNLGGINNLSTKSGVDENIGWLTPEHTLLAYRGSYLPKSAGMAIVLQMLIACLLPRQSPSPEWLK
jgi:hypothetical protein